MSLDTCRICSEPVTLPEMAYRNFVIECDDGTDGIYGYYLHPSCDENATPEQLNAIRDAILGE